jgi:hypothetical protein
MYSTRPLLTAIVFAALAWAYFALFPEDLDGLLTPVSQLLALSGSVANGLYALLAVCVIAWAIVRVWGRPVVR